MSHRCTKAQENVTSFDVDTKTNLNLEIKKCKKKLKINYFSTIKTNSWYCLL